MSRRRNQSTLLTESGIREPNASDSGFSAPIDLEDMRLSQPVQIRPSNTPASSLPFSLSSQRTHHQVGPASSNSNGSNGHGHTHGHGHMHGQVPPGARPGLPPRPPVQPGEEVEPDLYSTSEIDQAATMTFTRPAPLPPLPSGLAGVEGWLKPAPTRTESIPDLGALAGDGRQSQRSFARIALLREEDELTQAGQRPLASLDTRPRLLFCLFGATCLTVGMVLGALLFSGSAGDDSNRVIIQCTE